MNIDLTPLINAGIAGVILLWFMLRLERILNRFNKNVELMARTLLRLLERHDPDAASHLSKALHRINGGSDEQG